MQHKFQGKDSLSFVLSPSHTHAAGWKSIAFKSESMQKLIANKPSAVKSPPAPNTQWVQCKEMVLKHAVALSRLYRIIFSRIIEGPGGWKQPRLPYLRGPQCLSSPEHPHSKHHNTVASIRNIRMDKKKLLFNLIKKFGHLSPRQWLQLPINCIRALILGRTLPSPSDSKVLIPSRCEVTRWRAEQNGLHLESEPPRYTINHYLYYEAVSLIISIILC